MESLQEDLSFGHSFVDDVVVDTFPLLAGVPFMFK
jgi:hypothetical protein